MANVKRHGIEKSREYSGEESCRELVKWLNEPDDGTGQKRVWEVLDAFARHASRLTLWLDPVTKRRIPIFRGELLTRLSKLSRRYSYYPLFMGFTAKDGEAVRDKQVTWLPASKHAKYTYGWAEEYDEMKAVFDLARVAEAGQLERIKKCDHCERWFFARFAHQRFCSGLNCREKAFRSSPAEKEKRRKWARKYYWIQKHKNVK